MPAFLLAALEMLGPLLARYFMLRAAWMVAKFFAVIGISMATNAYVVDPLLDHIESAYNSMPPEFLQWLRFLGFNQVLSIWLTASAIVGVKEVVFHKAG